MRWALPTQVTYCAGEQERVDRILEALWQFSDLERGLVLLGKCWLGIVNIPDHPLFDVSKDAGCAHVVCGRFQRVDEISRKQIITFHRGVTVWIDEDIGKRCCGESDVAIAGEEIQKTSNAAIDLCRISSNDIRIHGRIVGFIIDQEQRLRDRTVNCVVVSKPVSEVLQNCLMLLDHEENGIVY